MMRQFLRLQKSSKRCFSGVLDKCPRIEKSGNAVNLNYYGFENTESWLNKQPIEAWKIQFEKQGFAVINNIIDSKNLELYSNVYDALLSSEIDARSHRHDLGSNQDRVLNG